jgi:hypothetical protein
LQQPKARPPSRSVEPKIGLVLSPQAAGLACPTMPPVAHRGNGWRGAIMPLPRPVLEKLNGFLWSNTRVYARRPQNP